MASRHLEFVERPVLESAVSFLPWPGRAMRLGANVVFTAAAEGAAWAAFGVLPRWSPERALRAMLGSLSTGPACATPSTEQRAEVVALFLGMAVGLPAS